MLRLVARECCTPTSRAREQRLSSNREQGLRKSKRVAFQTCAVKSVQREVKPAAMVQKQQVVLKQPAAAA